MAAPRAGADKQGHPTGVAGTFHAGTWMHSYVEGLFPGGEGSWHVSQALGEEGSDDCVLFLLLFYKTTSFWGKLRKIALPSFI